MGEQRGACGREDWERGVSEAELATEADEAGFQPKIGERLKRARLKSGLRLRDVAERAACSESMLSKIENDKAVPSLTTLHRLCKALSVNVAYLLSNDRTASWAVFRASQRQLIGFTQAEGGEGTKAEVLVPFVEGRLLEGFVVVIEPGGHSGGPLQHKGEEVGYVIEGELELTIKREVFRLLPGDSFYFPSDLAHTYGNPGKTVMRAIWINTPPTF